MSKIKAFVLFIGMANAVLPHGAANEDRRATQTVRSPVGGETYKLCPDTYASRPNLPSPYESNGREYIVAINRDGVYAVCDVTVENRAKDPEQQHPYFKGMQLEVDGEDFPVLAATGLHSEKELMTTRTVTGRPVEDITETGRPEGISYAGFLAEDEDILGVLKADNLLVKKLGLTHPELARPLYHVWNLLLLDYDLGRVSRFWRKKVLYNGKEVSVKAEGSRGFQESLFNDEIRGASQFDLRRELDEAERRFLDEKYSHLSASEMRQLTEALTSIHTSEMVPYLVMRYGFYEGHTPYRADPIAVALIFGLKSPEEIEAAFEGKLFEVLTQHHPVCSR
jgi:hypothetical protein